ncbi:arsenic resistance N-acetyltransferase ArsN2 [Agrobacterium tumefaciens]|uniref:arsenic resistance N-acetyltransferase ArsN2 n=1 Tax=Agrobacterium tumefaciens TaxID=358 RepID=UPI0015746E9E|nr:arsenic resistance N-acetyltransferase ArsN2 [Agrobacterium tumefaciens]NTE35208.1 GNAT family N-acetyltransferase [Agrobacterium tumefaciens]NTE50718.1 GNAT family N-acetyltransferase [Agrobacterium tumefaciens]
MLNLVTLEQVSGTDAGLRDALAAAHLPTDDIGEAGRTFFKARADGTEVIGFSGSEQCGSDFLLRSVVVLSGHRGRGFGKSIVEQTIRFLDRNGDVYLATTTAASFFSTIGFSEVLRDIVPPAVLATRQLSSICPSSATIMKLNRPPT